MGTGNVTKAASHKDSSNDPTTRSKVTKNKTASIIQLLYLESGHSTSWMHWQCAIRWVFCSKSQTSLTSYKANSKQLPCLWPQSKAQKWNSGSCRRFTSQHCFKLAPREKREWKMALISSFSLDIMGWYLQSCLSQLTANLFLQLQKVSSLKWSECVKGTHGVGWESNAEENASIDKNSWQDLMIWP